jgi:fumarate reductase subunit D
MKRNFKRENEAFLWGILVGGVMVFVCEAVVVLVRWFFD